MVVLSLSLGNDTVCALQSDEAWKDCTGEAVIEAGLYLVRLNKYVAVEL